MEPPRRTTGQHLRIRWQQQPDLRTVDQRPSGTFKIEAKDPAAAAARSAKAQEIAVEWLRRSLKQQGRDIPVVDDLLSKVDIPKIQGVTK